LAPEENWTFWKWVKSFVPTGNRTFFSDVQRIAYSLYWLRSHGLPGGTVYHKFSHGVPSITNSMIVLSSSMNVAGKRCCQPERQHGVTTLKATIWTVTDMENWKSENIFCSHSGVFILCWDRCFQRLNILNSKKLLSKFRVRCCLHRYVLWLCGVWKNVVVFQNFLTRLLISP
jgi:hypothetical protein